MEKIWDIVNLDDEKWLSNINSAAAEIGCGHIASLPRRRRRSMQQPGPFAKLLWPLVELLMARQSESILTNLTTHIHGVPIKIIDSFL